MPRLRTAQVADVGQAIDTARAAGIRLDVHGHTYDAQSPASRPAPELTQQAGPGIGECPV